MKSAARDESFTAFFTCESGRLERFATLLVADPHEGAELAQEALARVYARWPRLRDGAPGAYARQVVVNLVRSRHRAKRFRRERPIPAWAGSEDHHHRGESDRVADAMQIAPALKALSPVRRAIVLLRFYDDMSEQEIAHLLDRPLGTVKSDIHRALKQLRASLDRGDSEGAMG